MVMGAWCLLLVAWRAIVNIRTTRFGEMEVDEKDVLSFGQGILGFEHLTRFFIVDPGDETLIMWLQSLDDDSVAFPIIEPQIFQLSYRAKLLPFELQGLGLSDAAMAKIYAILTIPKDITQSVGESQGSHCY